MKIYELDLLSVPCPLALVNAKQCLMSQKQGVVVEILLNDHPMHQDVLRYIETRLQNVSIKISHQNGHLRCRVEHK